MKTRIVILVLAVLLVAFINILLFRGAKQSNEGEGGTVKAMKSPVEKSDRRGVLETRVESHQKVDENSINSLSSPTNFRVNNPPNWKMSLKELFLRTVDVHGKVVDQNGSPVPNAVVNFAVNRSIYDVASYKNSSVTTDSQGLFHIVGYEGVGVSLRPEAPGYVLAEPNPHVIIKGAELPEKDYISDPKRPVLVKMWKNKGPEQLVSFIKQIRFFPKNGTIHLDLVKGGMVNTGGDIVIDVNRPSGQIGLRDKARWSLRIIPEQGGLIPVAGEVLQITFEAPDSGYVSEYSVLRDPSDKKWSLQFDGHFFVRSRNGSVYSKVSMSFLLNEDEHRPCWLAIRSLSNANSSRNWEEDPGKVVNIK